MRSGRHSTWLRALPAMAAVAAACGCDTASQDFTEWTQSVVPLSAGQAVRLMVDPYDPDNRYKGTVLIVNSPFGGGEPYVVLYRDRAAHETNPLVRAASIRALGRYGAPTDAPAIAANLSTDQADVVRWEAALALQRLHNPSVVPELLRTLRDENEGSDVRCAAAIALGQYPEDRVFQGLLQALDSVELGVNVSALESLKTLTGENFGLDPRPWLSWYKSTRDPFAGQRPYVYPTYQRGESFLEKLAFWSSESYEQPGTPAGLTPPGERSTYPDDAPASHDSGG